MSTLSASNSFPTSLLRAILRPSTLPISPMQTRSASKITLLEKLHRKQRKAVRQERLDSFNRADVMPPPDLSGTEKTITTTSTTGSPETKIVVKPLTIPYNINRTPSRQLPIYHLSKDGGIKHLTKLRKIDGDLHKLKDDLRLALGVEDYVIDRRGRKKENVTINWTTGQIVVRGWRRPEIQKWAEGLGF